MLAMISDGIEVVGALNVRSIFPVFASKETNFMAPPQRNTLSNDKGSRHMSLTTNSETCASFDASSLLLSSPLFFVRSGCLCSLTISAVFASNNKTKPFEYAAKMNSLSVPQNIAHSHCSVIPPDETVGFTYSFNVLPDFKPCNRAIPSNPEVSNPLPSAENSIFVIAPW